MINRGDFLQSWNAWPEIRHLELLEQKWITISPNNEVNFSHFGKILLHNLLPPTTTAHITMSVTKVTGITSLTNFTITVEKKTRLTQNEIDQIATGIAKFITMCNFEKLGLICKKYNERYKSRIVYLIYPNNKN